MPITNLEKRREYMRVYEEERRLGLRRTGVVSEIVAAMDERRESRAEYLLRWAVENRERRAGQTRERRRAARAVAEAAALRRGLGSEGLVATHPSPRLRRAGAAGGHKT